jgi:hypothetical protein
MINFRIFVLSPILVDDGSKKEKVGVIRSGSSNPEMREAKKPQDKRKKFV